MRRVVVYQLVRMSGFGSIPPLQNIIPKCFSIEGNVGAGKSTLLEEIKKRSHGKIPVIPEPIDSRWGKDDWVLKQFGETNDDGRWGRNSWKDCLPIYLRDRNRWFFTFQSEVMEWYSWHGHLANLMLKSKGTTIIERSKISSILFSQEGFKSGNLIEWEYNLLKKFSIRAFAPEWYIYLRTPPEVCCWRKNIRAREGEECTSEKQLERFHVLHELAFNQVQDREYHQEESGFWLSKKGSRYLESNTGFLEHGLLGAGNILVLDGELPSEKLADKVIFYLEENTK